MRVIAGTARGMRLAPVPAGTRPLSDRAREGLFSSLGPLVEGARVLDLYSGTGALGIEALSRGAVSATFVDRSATAVRAIRTNLDRTGLAERAKVHRREVARWLADTDPSPYDLVFLDPPYAEGAADLEAVLVALARGWLGGPGWTVALTRPKGGYIPVIPVNWLVARRLAYGDTLVISYREV
jgi:16S rRNA (guanine966-N2)-methyltransferase